MNYLSIPIFQADNADMANELKTVSGSKAENERRRKQLEMQCAELQMKLQESDKIGADSADKLSKVITELDLVSTALNEAENKASLASKNAEGLESQLSEATNLLEEETRQKLALNSKLRALEQSNASMTEQLEEEEVRHSTCFTVSFTIGDGIFPFIIDFNGVMNEFFFGRSRSVLLRSSLTTLVSS